MKIQSDYLNTIFSPKKFAKKIEIATKKLADKDFDSIAVTGNSGTLFGGALAYVLNKKLILVRKKNDNCHSYMEVEMNNESSKYIFLDDFVCEYSTYKRVTGILRKNIVPKLTLTGVYLYHRNEWFTPKTIEKRAEKDKFNIT